MNQSKRVRVSMVVLAVAALIGVGQSVWAYTEGACIADGEKFCPGQITTSKEFTACLAQHQAELSEPCKVNLAEGREMVRQTKDICDGDVQKFCTDKTYGKGNIRKCLRAHEAELSSACRDHMHAMRKKYKALTPEAAPAAAEPATATPAAK